MDFLAAEGLSSGPHDPSVLHLQASHRSELVWESEDLGTLTCRRRVVPRADERILPYLSRAGFRGLARISSISLDWHLITAFVERWRPETHTFHMASGELTVTLEDVQIILGLSTTGDPVTGIVSSIGASDAVTRYLGIEPPRSAMRGARIRLSWLEETFSVVPDGADDATLTHHARAYILLLFGGVLFVDKSQDFVHATLLRFLADLDVCGAYSWASAVLAYLYRQLCIASMNRASQIAGPLVLLQIWAWEHFPHMAPQRANDIRPPAGEPLIAMWRTTFSTTHMPQHSVRFFRIVLDLQTSRQVVWCPYTHNVRSSLPDYCRVVGRTHLHRVPLIFLHIVEHCHPDRVARQFGALQGVPRPVTYDADLHHTDLRGHDSEDWSAIHAGYIQQWFEFEAVSVDDALLRPAPACTPHYLCWYARITRRYITRTFAVQGSTVDTLEAIRCCRHMEEVKALATSALELLTTYRDSVLNGDGDDGTPEPADALQRVVDSIPIQYATPAQDVVGAAKESGVQRRPRMRGSRTSLLQRCEHAHSVDDDCPKGRGVRGGPRTRGLHSHY